MTSDREENMLRVLTHTSQQFYLCFGILSAVALWGVYGYIMQLRYGLIVTGLRDQISWVCISRTLSSSPASVTRNAHLGDPPGNQFGLAASDHSSVRSDHRVCLVHWRAMVIIDMGRPERMLYLFTHGRLQSVILWDVIAVSTYLAGCVLYLYFR